MADVIETECILNQALEYYQVCSDDNPILTFDLF